MADNKKMVEAITSMDVDFAQWYTDVVKKAELCDYASVKGCMVIKPAGYALWENIQKKLDARFKECGVQNGLCPGGGLGDPRRHGAASGADVRAPYLGDAVL